MSKRLATAAALEQRLAAVNGEEWDSGSEEEEEEEEEEERLVLFSFAFFFIS
jgi:ribosomal protein L12E/L44/L45/RPP1/RPP2